MNSAKRLDALTTLRFFAAAMIVIGHAHPLFGSLEIAANFSLAQGVSFFFILSGFILAYNYRSLQGGKSVKRFLLARFARIWPLHAITSALWIFLFYPDFMHNLISSADVAFKAILNVFLLQSWSFTAPWILSFNGAAWSISTEIFFYIVFAFILINPGKILLRAIMLSFFLLFTLIYMATKLNLSADDGTPGFTMFSVLYTNPVGRVFEFLFGVSCAKLFFKYRELFNILGAFNWLIIEIFAIVIMTYSLHLAARPTFIPDTLGQGISYYFSKSGIWFSWGFLILTFSLSSGPISRVLSTKPMVFLGEISFALYLVHISIYNLANSHSVYVKGLGVAGVLLFWFFCIASSSLLHIAIEKPCRTLIMAWWDRRSQYNRT